MSLRALFISLETFLTGDNHKAKLSESSAVHILKSFTYLSIKHCCCTWSMCWLFYLVLEVGTLSYQGSVVHHLNLWWILVVKVCVVNVCIGIKIGGWDL